MRSLFVLGRALFGGFFLYNAINHFQNREMLAGYAGSKGVTAPDVAVPASGALLLAGGASVITGLKPRLGLAALVAFLVPVSLTMHRYWDHEDQQQRMAEQINFMKNMALAGAALMMMELPRPWPVSADRERLGQPRETYPRLSPRELRALPA